MLIKSKDIVQPYKFVNKYSLSKTFNNLDILVVSILRLFKS